MVQSVQSREIFLPSSSSEGSIKILPSGKIMVGIRTRRVSFSRKVNASRSFPMSISMCSIFRLTRKALDLRQSGHHVVEYITIMLGWGLYKSELFVIIVSMLDWKNYTWGTFGRQGGAHENCNGFRVTGILFIRCLFTSPGRETASSWSKEGLPK